MGPVSIEAHAVAVLVLRPTLRPARVRSFDAISFDARPFFVLTISRLCFGARPFLIRHALVLTGDCFYGSPFLYSGFGDSEFALAAWSPAGRWRAVVRLHPRRPTVWRAVCSVPTD
jgi:hypothetical protein